MRWPDVEERTCSIARTLDVIGDRWTILILRELFNGVERFNAIRDGIGVSPSLLADRLGRLVDQGIVTRGAYRLPKDRERPSYALTRTGRRLQPILAAMLDWGDANATVGMDPPVTLRHAGCGATVHARLVCDAGHELEPGETAEVVTAA